MDERTWLAATDAYSMLDELFPNAGVESVEPQPRQSRLYLIACARRAWDRLPGVCRAVVALAEQVYGERVIDKSLRDAVYPHAENLTHCRGEAGEANEIGRSLVDAGHAIRSAVVMSTDVDPEVWVGFAHLAFFPFARPLPYFRRIPRELHSPDLIREVFGNPFRHCPPITRPWRTDTVTHLAWQIEATGDFTILPVLADALEDAGCDRREVLDHLRHGGPHARGCWALAWVLAEPRK
jgi:hypothetical protein